MNKSVKALLFAVLLACLLICTFFCLYDQEGAGPAKIGAAGAHVVTPTSRESTTEPPNVVPIQEKVVEHIPIAGSVKDSNGVVIVAARVQAYPVLAGGSTTATSAVEQQLSAQDGRFAFAQLEPGHYRFVARKTGFAEGRIDAVLVKGKEPPALDFRLTAGLGISGYVRDFAGKGIAGARVQAFYERVRENADIAERLMKLTERNLAEEEPSTDAVADAQGYYQVLGLEQATYRLRVAAATFAPAQRRYVPSPSSEVNFTLEVGGQLIGHVFDEAGAPIVGAELAVFTQPTKENDVVEVVLSKALPPLAKRESDADGGFVFDELGGAGKYQLYAGASGYVDSPIENVVVVASSTTELRIVLAPGAVIQGRVYGPNDQPLEGATVKANATGAKAATPTRALVDPGKKTDATGLFRFDTLEYGEYRIVASHDDYASAILVKIQPNGGDLRIDLPTGAAIGGMVTDSVNNQPIAGAEVSMQDSAGFQKKALTDSNGLYELRGVTVEEKRSREKDNDPTIQAIAPGYARNSGTKVKVVDGKLTPNQDIQLDRAGSVAGRVTDASGKGIGGVRLSVTRAHTLSLPMRLSQGPPTESSPDGTFTLALVSPGSEAKLIGEHPDYLESESAPFDLAPGQMLTDFALMMRIGGKLSGVVENDAGQPLKGALVALAEAHNGSAISISTMKRKVTSDAAGRFELHGIEEGEHTLLAELKGYLSYEQAGVSVIEGQTTANIVVTMTTGSTISGTVVDSQGQPVVNAAIEAIDTSLGLRRQRARSDTSGNFTIDELGPDPVDLNVEAHGYSKETRHQVPVNTEHNDFTMRKLGKIIGRVIDQNGIPPQAFSVAPKIYTNDRYLSKVPAKTISTKEGDEGRFEFPELESGTYQITIGAPGYTMAMFDGIEIAEDGVHDVGEVVLNEGGKIGGTVIDDANQPVFGANIILVGTALLPPAPGIGPTGRAGRQPGSPRRRTDRDGRFLIEGLAQNEVQIRIEHRDFLTQTITLQAGELENTIIMTRGGIIEGIITGSDGALRDGVQILLSGEGHSDRAASDRKGYYVFSGLQDGNYTLRVTQFGTPGGKLDRGDMKDIPTFQVSVYGGQTQTLNITSYDGPSSSDGGGGGGGVGGGVNGREDKNNE